jgi:2-oxo-4-hydroxy-4-carboxy--5-ureidoimidazoline (OHCU) decarboxylase
MPISYAEQTTFACAACGALSGANLWALVDLAERPDLLQALESGALNQVVCPQCGHAGAANAPLLVHDPAGRRVYFAAPAGAAEHELREWAQGLLYTLVGALPEEQRLPYLGDVQVEQEVAGVARALQRAARRRGARRSPPDAAPVAAAVVAPEQPPASAPDESFLLEGVAALLAADSADELLMVTSEYPALLDPAADTVLAQLVELAYAQADPATAQAIASARPILARLRAGDTVGLAEPAEPIAEEPQLPRAAIPALVRAAAPATLLDVVRDHPALLEPWADAAICLFAEAALDEGNERLAHEVELRREQLEELRAQLTAATRIADAARELLRTRGEDAVMALLDAHPALLTAQAQELLLQFADAARAAGDIQQAEYAIECRTLLQAVRAGLEEES